MYQHPFLRGEDSVPDGEGVAGEGCVVIRSGSSSEIVAENDVASGGGRHPIVRVCVDINICSNIVNVHFHLIVGMIGYLQY